MADDNNENNNNNNNNNNNENNNEENVNAVTTLKIPPFWTNLPAAWFVHVESLFGTRNVARERTRFDHVVASLPQEVIVTVFDIIQDLMNSFTTNAPNPTPYTTLKAALVERHSLSESQRIETLLSGVEIGDRKPSEFFRFLKSTAGSSTLVTEDLIKSLWMR